MRYVSFASIIFIWLHQLKKAGAFLHSQNRFLSPSNSCTLRSSLSDVDVRLKDGLIKMNTVMTADFFTKSPLLKQFYNKLTKAIEVRESSIPGAGLGLFAKKPIKANSIVSFYPAHALGMNDENPFVTLSSEDESYFSRHPSSHSAYLHCTDQPIFGRCSLLQDATSIPPFNAAAPVLPLFLDVNTCQKIPNGWVSHFINDGAVVASKSEQGVLDYYLASKLKKNCIHIPFGPSPIIATVTSRKVAKDEELLTMYGGVSVCTWSISQPIVASTHSSLL